MNKFLRVLVEIFITVRDENIAKGSYKRKRIPHRCDNCSVTPEKVFYYNASLLCEKCYNMTVTKFGAGK